MANYVSGVGWLFEPPFFLSDIKENFQKVIKFIWTVAGEFECQKGEVNKSRYIASLTLSLTFNTNPNAYAVIYNFVQVWGKRYNQSTASIDAFVILE